MLQTKNAAFNASLFGKQHFGDCMDLKLYYVIVRRSLYCQLSRASQEYYEKIQHKKL